MARPPFNLVYAGNCHYSTGGGNYPADNVVPARQDSETTTGVTRRKPKGFIPATPYFLLYRSISYAKGTCKNAHLSFPDFGQSYSGVVGGGTGQSGRFWSPDHFDQVISEEDSIDNSLKNSALIKARNALKSTDINLGVAFAERNATARLVGDTATRLFKSYRHLRRGEIRKAMDMLGITSARREPRGNNAPQKWLELQYGWKPLLSDVFGACDALSKRSGSDWSVTAKGRAKSTKTVSKIYGSIFDYGSGTAVVQNSAFCRIDAVPQNEALISLASLGITNPLLIGWELVPFSFVVDWFIPVGSYLESIDALLGYDRFSYSNSLLTKVSWEGSGLGRKDTGNGFFIDNSYKESKRIVRLDREASASVPFPRFPRFKDPRSLEHMANGLSLLATVFGRK
jgi:hypothetical protein